MTLFFGLVVLFVGPAVADAASRETVLGLLKKYSPTGHYIIDRYSNAPTSYETESGSITLSKTDFMTYVEGDSMKSILKSLNTAVHETCHGYTSLVANQILQNEGKRKGFDERYHSYYIGGNETIVVKLSRIFPSRKTASSFTKPQKTFRFSTYVNATGNMGTQVDGIYGLLDELNAYYHGTRTSFDLYACYRDSMPQTVESWLDFFSDINGTYYAHGEFKLFIAKYLIYAKKREPEVLKGILANDDFRRAYTKIDRNFSLLIRDYFALKKKIFSSLESKGFTCSEDDKFLWIKKDGSGKGIGNFLEVYNYLQGELNSGEIKEALQSITMN